MGLRSIKRIQMEKRPLIDGEIPDPPTTAELTTQRLTLKKKIIYGIAETGVCAVGNMVGFFLNTFLLEVAGVAPVLAGNIMLVGHVFDAFAHPIIGKISDATRTRWGRRRPWIFLGAIPYSIGYFALWQVLDTDNQALLFMYYFGILISLSIFGSRTRSLCSHLRVRISQRRSTIEKGVGALSTIMWAQVSAKIGKQKTYFIGASVFMATLLSTWFLPDEPHLGFIYGLAAFCGVGYGIVETLALKNNPYFTNGLLRIIAVLIPWSFLPDIIGQDELETGLKREGVFYAIFVLFQRGGLAMAVAVSSYVLGFAGYINPQHGGTSENQPATVVTALKLLIGPIPALLLLLSFIFVWFYPLTKVKVDSSAVG